MPLMCSSIQTRTSHDISEQRDRGLEGWSVPIGATIACASIRPLLPMIRLNLANSLSVKLAVPPSSSFRKFSLLCSDLSYRDSEISFFTTFTSAHMLAVVSFGVGGSRL